MPFAVQICSNQEWKAVKAILNVLQQDLVEFPYGEFFPYRIVDREGIFFHSGPTKTRSAGACQYAIAHWRPACLVVLGTCGAVLEDLRPLDIVLAETTVQYDCIERMDPQLGPFYEPMTTRLESASVLAAALGTQVRLGVIGTADQDLCAESLPRLRQAGVIVVDWESGAIAKICELNRIPCVILRGVTDHVGINQTSDYYRNTTGVMAKLLGLLPGILALE